MSLRLTRSRPRFLCHARRWQNTRARDVEFVVEQYTGTLNIWIKSRHAFTCDWGSSFYFRFTITSTMDQGAREWERFHYFRLVAWLPKNAGSSINWSPSTGLRPVDGEAEWLRFFIHDLESKNKHWQHLDKEGHVISKVEISERPNAQRTSLPFTDVQCAQAITPLDWSWITFFIFAVLVVWYTYSRPYTSL